MRRTKRLLSTIAAVLTLALLVSSLSLFVAADTANVPSLTISQLKITSSNGQFITLYNATNATLDMSKYQLEYFNSYDLAKATSSKLIALSGTVPPHGYFMVNDGALLLCYQLTVDSVSLGLSSTAGFIELLSTNQATAGGPISSSLEDYVGWSKTAATGAQTLPANTNAFLMRQPLDTRNNPSISVPGTGSWQQVQPDTTNPCKLVSNTASPLSIPAGLSQLLPTSEAPATIVSVAADQNDVAPPTLPASDIGLMAPGITELLPNPAGSGNDSTDEYVELYNPNDKDFDLSGFKLQTGLTSFHTYAFPQGTVLAAKTFKAYYSDVTSLSLSNGGSQVKLLDPLGNSIALTDPYGTAKDVLTWAKAKGKWYWTISATPNAANVIKQPVTAKKSSKAKAVSKVSSSGSAKHPTTSASLYGNSDTPNVFPIHNRALALIIGLALLYGAYEYRSDLANKLFQLRRNLSARRANRQ